MSMNEISTIHIKKKTEIQFGYLKKTSSISMSHEPVGVKIKNAFLNFPEVTNRKCTLVRDDRTDGDTPVYKTPSWKENICILSYLQ